MPATVVGTSGDDELLFGPGDVVYAGPGNDSIGPRDQWSTFTAHICGGAGEDEIWGGRGVDHVHGGGGADYINGGYGGADTLLGDGGDDRVEDFDDFDYPDDSDPGTDLIRGGSGADLLITASGSDEVYGDSGQDTIVDYTRAKSYLYGGADDDTIDATQNEAGTNPFRPDVVSGGKGHDVAVVNKDDIVTSSTEERIYR
jgi:serralysin